MPDSSLDAAAEFLRTDPQAREAVRRLFLLAIKTQADLLSNGTPEMKIRVASNLTSTLLRSMGKEEEGEQGDKEMEKMRDLLMGSFEQEDDGNE